MTDREKAIVMAHTGICMLTGNKFQIFHKYIENIMCRPIMTHEIGWLADEIKEKSKADFMALCADESSSEKPNRWIPVDEEYPDVDGYYLGCCGDDAHSIVVDEFEQNHFCKYNIIAWMPLPPRYKPQESEDEK